jgi:hypothetical protein
MVSRAALCAMLGIMIWGGRPRLALRKGGVVASVVALILFLGRAYSFTEEGRESPVIHGGDESPTLLDKHLF